MLLREKFLNSSFRCIYIKTYIIKVMYKIEIIHFFRFQNFHYFHNDYIQLVYV